MQLLLSCLLLFLSHPILQAAFDHSHKDFTSVLQQNVKGKKVDYAAIHKNPDPLGRYLVELATVTKSDFHGFTEKEQLAYLINLYNAATLKLIVDSYPLKSIRDLQSPWKQNRVKLFGEYTSLDAIEHERLRKDYSEPRIHFAVNCASIGCPALRNEAFTAAKLETQLDQQTHAFLNDPSHNRFDPADNTIHLSSIFDWFGGDFKKHSGSIEKFIAPYFPKDAQKPILSGSAKIKFSDYNWNLNDI